MVSQNLLEFGGALVGRYFAGLHLFKLGAQLFGAGLLFAIQPVQPAPVDLHTAQPIKLGPRLAEVIHQRHPSLQRLFDGGAAGLQLVTETLAKAGKCLGIKSVPFGGIIDPPVEHRQGRRRRDGRGAPLFLCG